MRLSVVMPVHNAVPYLDEAVESILTQSHPDFEFVIGDDGSDDGSTERLRCWAARDPRIRLFEGRERLGPARSSNWVVAQAEGDLIARMDADDISHPDRLKLQLAAFAARPDAVLIGSPAVGIDSEGRIARQQRRDLIGDASFGLQCAHGSVMFRRTAFENAGGYRAQCAYWEDNDLYLRIVREGAVLIMPDPVYYYRFAETSTRLTSNEEEVEQAVALMFRCRAVYLGGADYSPLLEETPGQTRKRVDPEVFWSIAEGRIWTGRSAQMAGRILRRAAFPRNLRQARVWVYLMWGSVNPKGVRFFLRIRFAMRLRETEGQYKDGDLYDWRPAVVLAPAR
jgi:hypothetical protein